MMKYFTWSSFSIVGICAIAYSIIGQEIAPDGTLQEPFFLIPISWIFLIIGLTLLVIQYIRRKSGR